MSQAETNAGEMSGRRAFRIALAVVIAATVLRIIALFLTPLQLYPDEAQYWLWSRHLAWGYASKPPLIAWLIRLTTVVGDSESWVRFSAPFLHAIAALALYAAGRRLYGAATGLLACTLWTLTPAVQVSALFIAGAALARYGLVDGRIHKLADIGAKHGISAERVRQLEREALQKLRNIADPDMAA